MTKQISQLGRRIQRLRKKKEITQERLAEHIHVSTSYMGRVERGVRTPNLKLLTKIARVLEVKVKDLIPF